jgi:hypothetical protein
MSSSEDAQILANWYKGSDAPEAASKLQEEIDRINQVAQRAGLSVGFLLNLGIEIVGVTDLDDPV